MARRTAVHLRAPARISVCGCAVVHSSCASFSIAESDRRHHSGVMNQNGSRSSGPFRPLPCRFPKPPRSPRPTPFAGMPTAEDARTFLSSATPTVLRPICMSRSIAPARKFAPSPSRRPNRRKCCGARASRTQACRAGPASKFGPLTVFFFAASKGTPRQCLAYVRAFDDPRLQLSGWFCQGGSEFIQQSTLACALDRLTLLAAGSEPKVGVLFAQAERNRSFCGQRDPILAATPKYHLLWKALANRPKPRRIGR